MGLGARRKQLGRAVQRQHPARHLCAAVGPAGHPGFNSGYYGNPSGGGNAGELYAFFNFASDSAFNRVQLIQNGGGGFEFDDLTVGTSVVSTAPEPATWAMFLMGFGLVGGFLRQRRDRVQALPLTA
ncbi:PEPxxWA-CTERM sorting domain-containing protein [Rhizorhabdus sp.]|uniref:PEPxxWA-CTERM sorting domain-containing protein n=1 Tax=Rhizorhabdus sp. TaxID=1968843 RepID=UPI0035B29EE1